MALSNVAIIVITSLIKVNLNMTSSEGSVTGGRRFIALSIAKAGSGILVPRAGRLPWRRRESTAFGGDGGPSKG